jgi:RNA polymerase sigma-70 factor (ECF subfamily)
MHKHQTIPLGTASDAELVDLILHKDEAAARALMQRYNRRLYRVARSVVRDDGDAEDVLQEAYLKAFAALPGFRADASLSTWLIRIVVNEALQRLRKRTDVPMPDSEANVERQGAEVIAFPAARAAIDPERAMAQRQLCQLVEQAIDRLPLDFRTVLVARVIEGLSVEETAAALGLLAETVKTRLHRARHLLKDELAEHMGPQFAELFPFADKRCERIAAAVVVRLKESGNL